MSGSRKVSAGRLQPHCEHIHPRSQTANQTGAQALPQGKPQPRTLLQTLFYLSFSVCGLSEAWMRLYSCPMILAFLLHSRLMSAPKP